MEPSFEVFNAAAQNGLIEIPSEAEAQRKKLDVFSAWELQHMNLPPVQWLVDGLIVRGGLGILAAPPKYGKSWLCLALCTSIATGKPFLTFETTQARTLYLALEDSKNRLQARQNKIYGHQDAPKEFDLAVFAETTSSGLFEQLEDFLGGHKDVGLIVIDTLQKVRSDSGGKNMYVEDYNEIGRLKTFADSKGVTILLVHHLRKMSDDTDPFNRISGSTAILGAADFAFVLTKNKRQDHESILSVTGRDIEEQEYTLTFDKEFCAWEIVGITEEVEEQRARMYYTSDPIVQTIKAVLKRENPWCGKASQLMAAVTQETGFTFEESPKAFSAKLKALVPLLAEYDGINYEYKRNGSGAGKHVFRKSDR